MLRDGFALAAAGGSGRFADIGAEVLGGLLRGVSLDRNLDEAVDHVMDGPAGLGLHSDVPEGVRALENAGCRAA